ncbi:class I SAM-dependent methyltransferase [Amycolatopsis panacis]|uniref:Methyltransferase domain-containing protein n=1 Tax=Amycolatopsis panacis TaxID=2340917 RepID=A0A419HUQ2_9PSEU|nr:class I SAM-dependent methyltransferase [Amycolatopsis panacis]RJQ80607.1 methyltransferase domain-containing protein [Amycolatopsis panacis]
MTMIGDRSRDGGRTEDRLVAAIEPLRHLALAHAVYALLDTGLADTLADTPGASLDDLAARHSFAPDRLLGYLHYLRNEGYVVEQDGGWSLGAPGAEAAVFRPWYQLLVGGYAQTFAALGPTLAADADWAGRNGGEVGAGACGMSMFDAVPLADRILETVTGPARDTPVTVIDCGCGDGRFLAELARRRPGLRGVGLEPDPAGVALARATAAEPDFRDRMRIQQGGALDAPSVEPPPEGPVVYLAAFVLQEVLEQDGEDAVVELLSTVTADRDDVWWLVLEVDHQPDDPRLRAGLGRAFYNPYYLIHAITEQRLMDVAAWSALFDRAGLECVVDADPDPDIDSTGLLPGMLLRRARPGASTPTTDGSAQA